MATATMAHNHPPQKYYTLGNDVGIVKRLEEPIPGLQEVQFLEECDIIFFIWSAFSQARIGIEAAVKILNNLPGNKPAVLVVLHQTFESECVVPDSSRAVNRKNTITVDCLLNKNQELLQSSKNDEALSKIINWVNPEILQEGLKSTPSQSKTHAFTTIQKLKCPRIKHFTLATGETLGQDVSIEKKLQNLIPGLQKVKNLEECDFILVFCPVVSRAGTDIEAAVKNLSTRQGNKPAVLVVLHHTFDPEYVAVDSSRAVTRENTVTVDCLFHEDQGLLQCGKNKEALTSVSHWIETWVAPKTKKWIMFNDDKNSEKSNRTETLKHFFGMGSKRS